MSGGTYAVILAGGKGERFWPLSTAKRPKQLLSLVGDKPLLAQAVERLEGLIPPSRIFVITNRDLVEASREAAPMVPPAQVVGEPVGRDTAAAVALGAALVKARDPQGVFCVLTADHVIGDLPLFQRTLEAGLRLAAREAVLVTIGMKPTAPSTAYGYIEAGEEHSALEQIHFLRALRFVEKPDAAKAGEYVATGRYYWNSGMFIWSVPTLAAGFARHRPVLQTLLEDAAKAAGAHRLNAFLDQAYPQLEKISIDYALMEKADNIIMARGTFAWDDVGSWTALEHHLPPTGDGNVSVGDCALLNARGNIVVSRDRVTALVGVDDLIVVQAEGVTLVCSKERAQHVKQLLEVVRAMGHQELL